jgi:hypothetical protein
MFFDYCADPLQRKSRNYYDYLLESQSLEILNGNNLKIMTRFEIAIDREKIFYTCVRVS